MISNTLYRHALTLVILALLGCGHGERGSAFVPVPVSEIEQVTTAFDGDLATFKCLPVNEALPKFAKLVERAYEVKLNTRTDSRLELIEETARQGRIDLVEALDARLGSGPEDSETRRFIHVMLATNWVDERMISVRDRLARIHPDSIALARYRPGGVEFLFGILEDRKRSISDRVDSATALSKVAWSADIVVRLRALEGDTTEVPGVRALGFLEPNPTLGQYVGYAIKMIKLRAPK